MKILSEIESQIQLAYRQFCSDECSKMWMMDNNEEETDKIIETYCEKCLIKEFIKNGLGINTAK